MTAIDVLGAFGYPFGGGAGADNDVADRVVSQQPSTGCSATDSGGGGSSSSGSKRRGWHCYVCGRYMVVDFLIAAGAENRCRKCNRTVCSSCSTVPLRGQAGQRTCQACYLGADGVKREKYVFLVRHAQSTWNQNVDMVKTLPNISFQVMSLKDVVSRAAHLMAKEMWHRDHPISREGVRQTGELRQKIAVRRRCETEREQRYYDSFMSGRKQIYCSPLLRALQTAHLALPEEDGWGSIKLLKDARERFSFVFERDCLGTGVGTHIVERAMQIGQDLPGIGLIRQRVDATDCNQKWWSDEPETDAELEVRLNSLWRRLLDEDSDDSCVLVTHSNLIKALLMRFGGVGEEEREERRQSRTNGDDEQEGYPHGVGGLGTAVVPDDERLSSPREGVTLEATTLGPRHRSAPSSLEAWAVDDSDSGSGSDEEPGSDDDEIFMSAEEGVVDDQTEDPSGQRPPLLSRWRRQRRRRRTSSGSCWQVVNGGPEDLRRLKVERLQNCGVLGLHCVLESPMPKTYPEVDGWIDVDSQVEASSDVAATTAGRPLPEPRWVAKDALLMFDSVLVK